MLSGREYGVLRAPQNQSFILGDTVLITRQPTSNGLMVGVGFNQANMHVLLPVSPKTCLQLGIPGLLDHQLKSEEVALINTDQAKLMHRYVYGSAEDQAVQTMVDSIGGSLNYLLNAFVIPEISSDVMLDFVVNDILSGNNKQSN